MRALVTGGAKRIGREIALYLAARGADVAVHYSSSEDDAAKTQAAIAALGRKAQCSGRSLPHMCGKP
jgi:NAD(P)-dependent dehydrogenase (short-subunit alcohol dehydrogenase family)